MEYLVSKYKYHGHVVSIFKISNDKYTYITESVSGKIIDKSDDALKSRELAAREAEDFLEAYT